MGRRGQNRRKHNSSLNGGQRLGNDSSGASRVPDGFNRIGEAGDGNCLFHALARQALGDPRLAHRARKEICDWMETNLLPSVISGGRSALTEFHRSMIAQQRGELFSHDANDLRVLRYVQHMRRAGEWGSGLEALCCAYCYGRPVHVWSPGGFSQLCPPSEQIRNTDAIKLLHNGRNHWDSLSLKEDALHSSAITHKSLPSKSCAEEEDEDTALALILSASFNDQCAPNTQELEHAGPDSDRDFRRALAVSAAEERHRQAETRGLGTKGLLRLRKAQQTSQAFDATRPCDSSNPLGTLPVQHEDDDLPSQEEALTASSACCDGDAYIDTLCSVGAEETHAHSVHDLPSQEQVVAATSTCCDVDMCAGASSSAGTGEKYMHSGHDAAQRTNRWTRRRKLDSVATIVSCDEIGEVVCCVEDAPARNPEPLIGAELLGDSHPAVYDCIAALCRAGFTESESAEIVVQSDFDVEQVKLLYSIEWDNHGRTVQLPFAT